MLRIIILLIIFLISSQERLIGQESSIYIKAGLLYDSKENKLLKNKLIQIRGTKIISVSEFESLPKNKQAIDLTQYTVLPGLIDAHTHVGITTLDWT